MRSGLVSGLVSELVSELVSPVLPPVLPTAVPVLVPVVSLWPSPAVVGPLVGSVDAPGSLPPSPVPVVGDPPHTASSQRRLGPQSPSLAQGWPARNLPVKQAPVKQAPVKQAPVK